jgi:hypothetical protein
MKLIGSFGKELKPGDKVVTFRGDEMTFKSGREPHKPSSTGRVYLTDSEGHEHEFFPGVIGASFQ